MSSVQRLVENGQNNAWELSLITPVRTPGALRRKLMNLGKELTPRLGIRQEQTMTEFVLIAATAVAVSVSLYQASGSIVNALLNRILPLLAS